MNASLIGASIGITSQMKIKPEEVSHMDNMTWNPKEAGKLANAKDQEIAIKQQEQAAVLLRTTENEHNRKQRAYSVIGPTLQRIKRQAQFKCAEFNTQISDGRNRASIQDNYGLGLDNAFSSFAITRNSLWAKLTSDYGSDWKVELVFSDGTGCVYEVVENSERTGVILKKPDQDFTEEEIALEACRFVCQ